MNLLGRKIEENKSKTNGENKTKKTLSYFEDDVLDALEAIKESINVLHKRIDKLEDEINTLRDENVEYQVRTTKEYKDELKRRTLFVEGLLEKELGKPPVIQERKPTPAEIYAASKPPLAVPKGKLP